MAEAPAVDKAYSGSESIVWMEGRKINGRWVNLKQVHGLSGQYLVDLSG
jgi:hypothetical protein